ncbi:MAG: hypothetical protein LBV18_01770 [Alistipes sp.]|jgi:hypothetical protein|nr:hypothetical protein [Alistipes sp.]
MKKFIYVAVCFAAVATLGSCKKKVTSTPGMAAKHYVEQMCCDNYEDFVEAIVFTEPVEPATQAAPAASADKATQKATRRAISKSHADQLRAVHHPDVTDRGGVKEVRIVSETPAEDNLSTAVVLSSHYNDGTVETINVDMVNENKMWKIRETPYKEIWKATNADGDTETIKIRSGHDRDFIKDNDNGERQFVKSILRRDGPVERIKTLSDGRRHREVIKHITDEEGRDLSKLIVDGDKIGVKTIDHANNTVVKTISSVDGERESAREVIEK